MSRSGSSSAPGGLARLRAGLLGALLASGCAGVDSYRVELERGEVALALGETEDAADAYQSALLYRSEDPVALHGLARSYLAQGDGESALAVLSRLERSDAGYFSEQALADYHLALYQAGGNRLRKGDSAGALRLLRRLKRLEPERGGLDELLVQALIVEGGRLKVGGRPEDAELLFREALGSERGRAESALALAEILIESGRVSTAISVLSDALRFHPDDPRLQALMGRALEIRYPRGRSDGN